jgi:17beta-estradiol 17-dehydrogenase / very-long-chain 3-oxoacyl-CoA reductase
MEPIRFSSLKHIGDSCFEKVRKKKLNGRITNATFCCLDERNSKKGLIINLGSFAGLVPTPYLSVYSGSKAFLSSWSQAIGAELAPKGITVQNVNTYFVVSAMSKIRRATMLIPMPKPYVRSVLGQIGISGGASTPFTSTPFYSHAIANWLIDNTFGRAFWVKQNYNIQVDIRKRALRKREREAAAAAKSQ